MYCEAIANNLLNIDSDNHSYRSNGASNFEGVHRKFSRCLNNHMKTFNISINLMIAEE